jgi:Ca-activated chloride channel family protein
VFRFQHPWFVLLLLPLAAALVVAWCRRPPALIVSSLEPVRAGFGASRGRWGRWRWPLLLHAAGLLLAVVALMRPQFGQQRYFERTEGIDIMLVLDVSGSMEAIDVPPELRSRDEVVRAVEAGRLKSRLEVAKQELRRFVRGRPDDRIGLIAFARLPYIVCPPTLDHDFLLGHLEQLAPGMLPDGTNLASPIASATARLKDSPARRRVMVLFTDGENNVEARITPRQAAQLARTFKSVIYTVGVGSERAVVLAAGWFGRTLQPAEGGHGRALLEELAGATGGRYFAARDAAGFAQVMREIDALETTRLDVPRYVDYRERFAPWLAAAISLILAGFVLERTLCQTLP